MGPLSSAPLAPGRRAYTVFDATPLYVGQGRRAPVTFASRAQLGRLRRGYLSFCFPILDLYGDFILEEQIVVKNDSAPSYVQAGAISRTPRWPWAGWSSQPWPLEPSRRRSVIFH